MKMKDMWVVRYNGLSTILRWRKEILLVKLTSSEIKTLLQKLLTYSLLLNTIKCAFCFIIYILDSLLLLKSKSLYLDVIFVKKV